MKKSRYEYPVPEHQADAVLSQAAPVQNDWYVLLDTTRNCVVYGIEAGVATTDETLECRVTIDGQVLTGGLAPATAGTPYFILKTAESASLIWTATIFAVNQRYLGLMGRSVKIEVRKTTAAGAGTITARVQYARW